MNKIEITKLISIIATAYQNFQVTQLTTDLWQDIIGGMDYELAAKALRIYISQGKDFPPNPGHIKQIAISLTKPIEYKQTAAEAWELCCMGASGGKNGHPSLSPRGHAAARQAGWDRIRYADFETELPFVRNNFIRAYESMEERDEEFESQTKLPELATNLIEMSKPKLVGTK